MSDFLVVGGGITGLMLARALAEQGADVCLLERQEPGRAASWASGGILTPLYPWRLPIEVLQLAAIAQADYPGLVDSLRDETGIDPQLDPSGLLYLRSADEAEALDWSRQTASDLTSVDAAFLYDQEPEVAPEFNQALWQPQAASIRPPRLLQALMISAQKKGVRLHSGTPACALLVAQDQVLGVQGLQQQWRAQTTLLCAGAWCDPLLQPLGLKTPLKPVSGQMLLYQAEPGLLNHMLVLQGRYLIPRQDGLILAGSTLEYVGFDDRITDDARLSLQTTAGQILPALRHAPVIGHWAGLRPGSPEGIPWVGPVPGYQNLYMSGGHFRGGLSLAPGTTRLLVDALNGRPSAIDASIYWPQQRLQAQG